ncbi:hypothetical protein SAMN05444920_113173 [Nonomuraea solani]|uniref:Uncharacterized protein n=1 Tax=Nonomuraea solani TaxID=1144553 RepID=A0A1H6EP15_9ACTN|nr:hypothetical protein [Nonomuraea solani]SEG99577.1 hypothetical protein SAMN05444920_113173 [Nonomuraea solani]
MKRVLAAAVAAAALLGASPAQAVAPKDPVQAVKSRFAPGHGVKISEINLIGKSSIKLKGTYGFGRSGVVAADLSFTSDIFSRKSSTLKIRTVGKYAYMSSDDVDLRLPEGKTWIRMKGGGRAAISSQPVDLFRPPQLKALLSHAGSVRDGVHRGTLTDRQARKVSDGRGHDGFGFRLSTDASGLPTRLYTTDKESISKAAEYTDTRYTAWGHEVTIAPPPDHEVIDEDAVADAIVDELLDELKVIPNEALGSQGR